MPRECVWGNRALTRQRSPVNPLPSSVRRPFPLPSAGPPTNRPQPRPRRPARARRNAKETPPAKSRTTSPATRSGSRLSGRFTPVNQFTADPSRRRSVPPGARPTVSVTAGLPANRGPAGVPVTSCHKSCAAGGSTCRSRAEIAGRRQLLQRRESISKSIGLRRAHRGAFEP